MNDIWQEILELLLAGESFVVATIFDKSGSAPRTAGAKMVVKRDGSIIGTIGGGRLEGEARLLAAEVFRSAVPCLQNFNLTGKDAEQMDMICGGTGEIFLDYLDGREKRNLTVYQEIAGILAGRETSWLITELPADDAGSPQRRQCLVRSDGTLVGNLKCEPGFLENLTAGSSQIASYSDISQGRRVLIEPIRNKGVLYIFGAGHVSQQIAPLAEGVGFRTVVIDDRSEYVSRERFPISELILLTSFTEPLPDLPLDKDSYLVIVTRGHLHDKTVLGQVLKKPTAYLGMIGSKRKRDMIFDSLQTGQGFAKEDFGRINSPIGLDILAETPEEIAVSIVAELIKVRAERENHGDR
ncbi:MAG: XdhC family aldehyde oxidoreductase maturation factor [Peptococcaceae bacterium]